MRKKSKMMKRILCMTMMLGMLLVSGLTAGSVYAEEGKEGLQTGYVELETVVEELPAPELSPQSISMFALRDGGLPELREGEYEDWFDRIKTDDMPEYVTDFYRWLVENSDGDSTDALIDPTQVTTADSKGNAAYLVKTFTWEIPFENQGSLEGINTYVSNAMAEDVATNYNTVQAYITAAYHAFDRDYPEVFWLDGSSMTSYEVTAPYSYNPSTFSGTAKVEQNVYFYLQYDYTDSTEDFDIRATDYRTVGNITTAISARDKAVENIMNDMASEEDIDTKYEKVAYFNDWLTKNNCYNSSANLNEIDHDCRECTGALSGLNDEVGPVCEAYARAFKVLCDAAEIPCTLVSGDAYGSVGGTPEGHMWNLVQSDNNNWYAVDVTWNDPSVENVTDVISESENEDYLLVGSGTVIDDMTFSESHVMDNQLSSNGVAFTNQPTVSAERYAYKVTFAANDNTDESETQLITENESLYIENNYLRDGYLFVGWNTMADGSGTSYENMSEIAFSDFTENLTLYAQWAEPVTVTYMANNGTEDFFTEIVPKGVASHTYDSEFYYEGYVFDTWNMQADGSGTEYPVGDRNQIYEDDITLYAQWTEWSDVLYVGGVQLTDGKYLDEAGNVLDAAPAEGGYAYYDADTNTLTLNDFTYEGSGYMYEAGIREEDEEIAYSYNASLYKEGSLNIVLTGENAIKNNGVSSEEAEEIYEAIYVWGRLDISGDGSLNIVCHDTGLFAGYLNIENCTINMETVNYGIYADFDVAMTGVDFTAESESDFTYITGDFAIADSEMTIRSDASGIYVAEGKITFGTGSKVDISVPAACAAVCGRQIILDEVSVQTPYKGNVKEFDDSWRDEYTILYEQSYYQIVDMMGDVASKVIISGDAAAESIGETLAGYSIALDGNINVNFHFVFEDALASSDTAYVLFTLPDGSTKSVLIKDAVTKEDESAAQPTIHHIFTCEVAAKEMASDIKAQVIVDEENKSSEYTYSVKDYGEHILKNSEDYSVEVYSLVEAMLNYGAYAQQYFTFNTGELANEYFKDAAEGFISGVLESPTDYLESEEMSLTTNAEIGNFTRANLVLESDTVLRVYFKPAENMSIEDLSFTFNEETITPVQSGEEYLLKVDDIKAHKLADDSVFAVAVKDDDAQTPVALSYNPMSYCYNVLTRIDVDYSQELKNVAAALYNYNSCAAEYINSLGGEE